MHVGLPAVVPVELAQVCPPFTRLKIHVTDVVAVRIHGNSRVTSVIRRASRNYDGVAVCSILNRNGGVVLVALKDYMTLLHESVAGLYSIVAGVLQGKPMKRMMKGANDEIGSFNSV